MCAVVVVISSQQLLGWLESLLRENDRSFIHFFVPSFHFLCAWVCVCVCRCCSQLLGCPSPYKNKIWLSISISTLGESHFIWMHIYFIFNFTAPFATEKWFLCEKKMVSSSGPNEKTNERSVCECLRERERQKKTVLFSEEFWMSSDSDGYLSAMDMDIGTIW